MSDLLSIGRSGVLAYQGALQTIGENVTNSDTDGYARRSVLLKEQPTTTSPFMLNRTGGAFGGVQAAGAQRVWDQYKAANAWSANADANGASTRAHYLSTMETMLNDTSNGVGTRLTAVFTSATQLAASPNDPSLRQAFLASLSDAATAINVTADNLTKLSGTITTQTSVLVTQVNDTMKQLASINMALHTASPNTAGRAQLEDQRDNLLGTLSGAISVDTSFAADGSVTVRLNNSQGPLLVDNSDPNPSVIEMKSSVQGVIALSVHAGDTISPGIPTGGTLAGLISGASTNADTRTRLDGLAAQFIAVVNDTQAAGVTDAGVAGVPLLDGTDAATIKLNKDVTIADIAVATVDADGNKTANGNLLALTSQRGPDGVEQGWKTMVSNHALLVSSANTESAAASTRKESAYTSLDETTGVDLDTEAAELLRFQQAYSASAKIIQTARETLQDILNLF